MCIRAKAIYIEAAGLLLLFVLLIGFGLAPGVFAAPFVVVFVVLGVWLVRLRCPRCKYPLFKGNAAGHFAVWLPIPPRECRRCALSFVTQDTREEGAHRDRGGARESALYQGKLTEGAKPEYPIRVDFYRDGELLERVNYEAEWELLTDLESFDSDRHASGEQALVFDRHERPVRLRVEAMKLLTFELVGIAPAGSKGSSLAPPREVPPE